MMSVQNLKKIRRCQERVATEWRLATLGRAVVGLVARLFALPPGPPGRLFGAFATGNFGRTTSERTASGKEHQLA